MSISTSGDFSQTNKCGTSLAAGNNCAISVTFTPTIAGIRAGSLMVADNAAASPQTVSLRGSGTNGLTVTPTSLAFGSVVVGVTSAAKTITVTNDQAASAGLSIGISGTNPGNFALKASATTCGAMLAAKGKCTYAVVFKPTKTSSRSASLSISDGPDPTSPYNVGLSGSG